MRILKLSNTSILGAAFSALLLANQALAADIPYQARPSGKLTTGYTVVKNNDNNYTVVYSAADEAQAKKFMELRAAQVGQGAGFTHFVVDESGTRTFTIEERYLENNFGIYQNGTNRDGTARLVMDYVPRALPMSQSKFYDVYGKVTFLTAEEARSRPNAIQISQVLAANGK